MLNSFYSLGNSKGWIICVFLMYDLFYSTRIQKLTIIFCTDHVIFSLYFSPNTLLIFLLYIIYFNCVNFSPYWIIKFFYIILTLFSIMIINNIHYFLKNRGTNYKFSWRFCGMNFLFCWDVRFLFIFIANFKAENLFLRISKQATFVFRKR